MTGHVRSIRGLAAVAALALATSLTTAIAPPVEAAPEGQISFAVHVTLAPKWLDPGETERPSRRSWSSTRSTTRS